MRQEILANGWVRIRAEEGKQVYHRYAPESFYSEAVVKKEDVPRFSETGGSLDG